MVFAENGNTEIFTVVVPNALAYKFQLPTLLLLLCVYENSIGGALIIPRGC